MDCVKSSGAETVVHRAVPQFTAVQLEHKMEVEIVQGDSCSVTLSAGDNILENVHAAVTSGTLILTDRNTCNFVRGYKRGIRARVTAPFIRKITNNSVGNIRFAGGFVQDTIVLRAENSGDIHLDGHFNEIRTSSHGNGDMYLSGKCNSLYVYAYGTNFLKAESLAVKNFAFIHSMTIGDCFVNAEGLQRLEYNIENDGNIYYRGEPGLIIDYSTGEGVLKKLED